MHDGQHASDMSTISSALRTVSLFGLPFCGGLVFGGVVKLGFVFAGGLDVTGLAIDHLAGGVFKLSSPAKLALDFSLWSSAFSFWFSCTDTLCPYSH